MQVRADIVNIDILREAYIGELSGLTEQDVFQRFPKIFSEWSSGKTSSFPGGESQSDMTERARNALKIVAEICSPTLVVTHRTLLTAMRGIVGLPDATPATHDYGMISPDPGDCIDKREWRNLFPNAADLGE
jgi:broad specificity phosphatase PhoE